jgi:ATP-dependent Clp protease adaptor protein ClpS
MPVECEVEPEVATGYAPKYRVICHDDPKTTMDFVIFVLMKVFLKSAQDATNIMLEVHKTKAALVGVMPLEEAEFRVERAHAMARDAGFPLTFTYEPE